ncbi:MAG: fasciclin domain-containing protein, partial [Deinococcales bacterium]
LATLLAVNVASAEGEARTIVDVAVSNPDFSTLVTAVTEAGLVDTLNSEGPFTVFAPTNEAFAALPEGQLDALLANKEQLAAVLTYTWLQAR